MQTVTCFGGPWDGFVYMLFQGQTGWDVWRSGKPESPERQYLGRYNVDPSGKRAVWTEADGGTL